MSSFAFLRVERFYGRSSMLCVNFVPLGSFSCFMNVVYWNGGGGKLKWRPNYSLGKVAPFISSGVYDMRGFLCAADG